MPLSVDNECSDAEAPILAAHQLVKVYTGADRPAVDGLDITIRPGEIFGLLGPNGAGKTTTISIMSTLLLPTSGSVSICNTDGIKHPKKVRRMISLVPQDIALYPEMTARENLRYFGRLFGLQGKKLAERIENCLEQVGLENKGDKRVFSCSGGMKRRINLAVGILNKPIILFLDEPTVGIDAQSRNMILEKLLLLKDTGTTIVYTTHYMEEAEKLCTRIIILDDGKNIAEGRPRELVEDAPGCNNLQDFFFSLTGRDLRD